MPEATPAVEPFGGEVFPGSPRLRNVVAESGESWLEHRKTLLEPVYARVWWDIVWCHLMIFGSLALVWGLEQRWGGGAGLVATLVLGAWIGLWLHALLLHGHEAAHGLIASSRRVNDALANVCIWPLFLTDVRTYRASHWVHHKRLGFPDDTEVSYHTPLSIKYIMELASWLHAVKTLTRGGGARASSSVRSSRLVPLIGFALHASIVGGTLYLGRLGPCVAWVIGLMTFAGLNGVRQLLEHRSLEADPRIDYRQVPHGPMNRMFSTGWMSRAIGAAGFNRHLLHHWDPGVSFTRFDEMEFFLMQTNMAADLDAARTTYLAVALRFLRRE